MQFRLAHLFLVSILPLLSVSGGCGYALQNSRNELLSKEGIRKIYIAPFVNDAYKPGAESVVFSALLRRIASQRRVQIVSSVSDADAILTGTVNASANPGPGTSPAQNISPSVLASVLPPEYLNVTIATEYTAVLNCSFSLSRSNTPPGKKTLIWSASFSRIKPFPGSNQFGPIGTTSALINDSEFDRALADIAQEMSSDVNESMLAMF